MGCIDILCGGGTLAVMLGFLSPLWLFLFVPWFVLELLHVLVQLVKA